MADASVLNHVDGPCFSAHIDGPPDIIAATHRYLEKDVKIIGWTEIGSVKSSASTLQLALMYTLRCKRDGTTW